MAGLSAPGLGSGLDVNGIVAQLMAVERAPLQKLDQQEAGYQARISGYGGLKSALSNFQSALDKLADSDLFEATRGTSSNDEVVGVSTQAGLVPASYDVTVTRLAQAHKLGSGAFADTATFGGQAGDQLVLTSGSKSFTLDLSSAKTLEEIQAAINDDANETGITAGLITGDNGQQTLVLSAGDTGYANRVQVSFGGTLDAATFGFTTLNRDADGNPITDDQQLDAALTVDGVALTRGTNRIDDVVAGVTLDLKATGSARVSVEKDPGAVVNAVQGMVDAYNELAGKLEELSGGLLKNSSLVRNVEARLRGVFNQAMGGGARYGYLAELGVTTDRDTGRLNFDSAAFREALEAHPDDVSAFFSSESRGLVMRMDRVIEGFTKSGGIIDGVMEGTRRSIKQVADQREALNRRLDQMERRLRDQFGALDQLVARMNNTSNYLAGQLQGLSKMING